MESPHDNCLNESTAAKSELALTAAALSDEPQGRGQIWVYIAPNSGFLQIHRDNVCPSRFRSNWAGVARGILRKAARALIRPKASVGRRKCWRPVSCNELSTSALGGYVRYFSIGCSWDLFLTLFILKIWISNVATARQHMKDRTLQTPNTCSNN